MRKSYPYPLPADALAEFLPPSAWHVLGRACRHEGEILAGNGYVALRAARGAWLDHEFPEAGGEFVARFGKLPWGRWPAGKDEEWRLMAERGAELATTGEVGLWLKGKLAPSPVWLVNDKRVRLSLLQLVARLPRAEVFTGRQDADDPVWVRFSGGRVALAMDKRLTMFSREIFQPYRDGWTGERVERPGKFLGVKSHLKDWPPADFSDV